VRQVVFPHIPLRRGCCAIAERCLRTYRLHAGDGGCEGWPRTIHRPDGPALMMDWLFHGRHLLYDRTMNQTALRILAWSLLLLIAAVTLSPIGLRPGLPLDVDLERALAFLALGFAFALAYPRKLWAAAAIVLLGAFGLELLQFLRPDRHGRAPDALVKAGAACIGLGLGWLAFKLATRRPGQTVD
jgi:hypothetical protein